MGKKINLVGVDVGSKELVVAMKKNNEIIHGTFDNTKSRHKKLLKFVTTNNSNAKVCTCCSAVVF